MNGPGEPPSGPSPSSRPTFPALGWGERLGILAIVVVQFLVGHGPVWKTQFHWNAAIVWSYVSIPPLVAAALAWRRSLRPLPWFLHTLELAGMKFVITASTLLALLPAASGSKVSLSEAAVRALGQAPDFERVPAPPSPREVGRVRGRVRDASGQPLQGALVYLAGTVEGFSYPAPTEPVRVENDGHAFVPGLAAARVEQPVELSSSDKRLHTALISPRGATSRANLPLLAHGAPSRLHVPGFQGVTELHCTVHGAAETPGFLGLFAHPFFTFTSAAGEFLFEGVPIGRTAVRVFRPQSADLRRGIEVYAGKTVELEVVP